MYGIGDGPRVGFLRGDFQGFRKPGQPLNAEGRCTDLQCVRLVCHFFEIMRSGGADNVFDLLPGRGDEGID